MVVDILGKIRTTPPEKVVAFTVLGLTPPSVNHHKVPCVRRNRQTGATFKTFRLTPETLAFYTAVIVFARGRTVAPEDLNERKRVRYLIRANVVLGKGKRGDADNFGKCICDGLQAARVIHSDAFVVDCSITVQKNDRENPRTEFHVERLEIQ